ncbi:MAG: barstar family protein [Oscillospiraceae bacterium]
MTNAYLLDGSQMQDLPSAHRYLKEMLNFPEYYGNNLDALFDCLTEFSDETLIWIENENQMHPKLEKVFLDAMDENSSLMVILESGESL